MNFRFITSSEKKQIIEKLNEQFGIEELPYLLGETGKEKIRAFSGSFSKDEILQLAQIANIEIIGMYIIKREHGLRLSFDATQILSKEIKDNIVDITPDQREAWLRGEDLDISAQHGTVLIRQNNDFLGCGKSTGVKIINHVPKERRRRHR
ncbi:hypothetical protein J4461_03845 [Candidatus Pacearchaeota archaeon]|nr:hypothetical protein [Candidatus Pacearchaeota archaeon]